MGKFTIFLLAGAATGIWYAMHHIGEPVQPETVAQPKNGEFRLRYNDSDEEPFEGLFTIPYKNAEDVTASWKIWKTYRQWETPSEIVDRANQLVVKSQGGTWKSGDCNVHVSKLKLGNYGLSWNRGENYIAIYRYWDDVIVQSWMFGPSVTIRIKFTPATNHIFEHWKMGEIEMVYGFNEYGTRHLWPNFKKDVGSLMKYRHYISSWCEENEQWVARLGLPCKIYSLEDRDILF